MLPTLCTPSLTARFAFARLGVALAALTLGGCASYRYDISPVGGSAATSAPVSAGAPAEAYADAGSMAVVADRDLVLPAAPARLRLRQVESRCVLLIENPTDSEMTLDGSASAIVDPLGQSREVAGKLILPGAFAKLVLPPLRDAPPTGPAFQIGVGMWAVSDTPRRAQFLDVGRAQDYWEWDGPGKIRVVLTLKQKTASQAEQSFRHEFVLSRTKR